MLEVIIKIDGAVITHKTAKKLEGEFFTKDASGREYAAGKCLYETDNGKIIYHDYDSGAENLAIKLLLERTDERSEGKRSKNNNRRLN